MKDLSKLLASSLKVSLEDNAQVEVNFQIDTDDNGAPSDDDLDVVEVPTEDDEPSEDETEMNDSEEETDAAEADMDQLQEAQDSLESLGVILNTHVNDGTMSRMGMGFYKIALESIVGSDVLKAVDVPSFESREYSKHHASLIAMESHHEIANHINTISMEANFNFIKKTIHFVDVLIRGEKALAKRATGLKKIAESSENEQSSNDELKVNQKGGPTLSKVFSIDWDNEQQFVTAVKEFTKLYGDMVEPSNSKYDSDFITDVFPSSNTWTKNEDGLRSFDVFGIRVIKDKGVTASEAKDNKTAKTVPNLSPANCVIILDEIINLMNKGDVLKGNIHTLIKLIDKEASAVKANNTTNWDRIGAAAVNTLAKDELMETNERVTADEGTPEQYNTLKALVSLQSNKNKVVTEILNYVNFSLTDREFN